MTEPTERAITLVQLDLERVAMHPSRNNLYQMVIRSPGQRLEICFYPYATWQNEGRGVSISQRFASEERLQDYVEAFHHLIYPSKLIGYNTFQFVMPDAYFNRRKEG